MSCLTVLHSADPELRDRVIPVGDGVCIGRVDEEGVDIAINDRLVSRKHATITPLGTSDVYELVDHDSRNGSFVDGVRVQRRELGVGTILRLGVSLFELTSGDAADMEPIDLAGLGARYDVLIGRSLPFRRMLEHLEAAAKADGAVLISGEDGVGMSIGASYVHRMSGCAGALVTIGCGSGPSLGASELFGRGAEGDRPEVKGYIAMAKGGSLFFEEIEQLTADLQPALLKLLESGTYKQVGSDEERSLDARIFASTRTGFAAAIQQGLLSQDLCDALSGNIIHVPTLRARRTDIPLLAAHFLKLEEPRRNFDWSATFLEKMLLHDWPLNVRELRAVARQLTMVEEDVTTLRSAHLPTEIRLRVRMPSEDALRASAVDVHVVPSRAELEQALERFNGDIQKVAEHYARESRHVNRWLKRHDLSAADYRKS